MPELPEVETMRRGVLPIVGAKIAGVSTPKIKARPILLEPELPKLRRRMVGRTITAIDRLGKRVVVRLDSGDALVIEPRMTGLVLLADPPSKEHLRLRIGLENSPAEELLFWDRRGLGTVRLFRPEDFALKLGDDRLGPDALATTWQVLQSRLVKSRRPIKVALLDQKAIAGVGNLYASEILHVAKVSPEQTCDGLLPKQWQRIHTAMLAVLEEAIRCEGSTLSDGTYRNALNQAGGYQNHHRVYDREGQPCPRCRKKVIVRIVQAQRSTFYCPACQ